MYYVLVKLSAVVKTERDTVFIFPDWKHVRLTLRHVKNPIHKVVTKNISKLKFSPSFQLLTLDIYESNNK